MVAKRFVDTNILLRYVLKDNEALYRDAKRTIEKSADDSLILTAVVAAEVVYVLRGQGHDRGAVVTTLLFLMELPAVETEDYEALVAAARRYGSSGLDFADCYILERAASRKLGLATQDKKLLRASERV